MSERRDDEELGIPLEPLDEPPAPNPDTVESSTPCRGCGYDVRGLASDGVCPECGFPIERTLGSDLLSNSSPEYVAKLYRGVTIVYTVIICMIVYAVLTMAAGLIIQLVTRNVMPAWIQFLTQSVSTLLGIVLIYGWWLFSEPDPASSGGAGGSNARKLVRVMLFVALGMNLLNLPLALLPPSLGANPGTVALLLGVGLLGLVVFATRYFAEMYYLQWLTPRIPDWDAHRRARLLTWLGPVLYTVGALCVGLGPLAALILYLMLLNTVREDIKRVRLNMPAA